jgi:hypothetical protein
LLETINVLGYWIGEGLIFHIFFHFYHGLYSEIALLGEGAGCRWNFLSLIRNIQNCDFSFFVDTCLVIIDLHLLLWIWTDVFIALYLCELCASIEAVELSINWYRSRKFIYFLDSGAAKLMWPAVPYFDRGVSLNYNVAINIDANRYLWLVHYGVYWIR